MTNTASFSPIFWFPSPQPACLPLHTTLLPSQGWHVPPCSLPVLRELHLPADQFIPFLSLGHEEDKPPELQLCSGDFWQSGTVPWCGTRDCAAKPSSVTFSTALEGSLRDSPKIWLQAPFYRWFISVVTLLKSGSLCECSWLQWPLGVCFPSRSPRLWLQGGKVSSLLCCPSDATVSPFLHVAISLKK